MNIFALHMHPKLCAIYHCDSHVSKMCLEYAQLMSTAHRIMDGRVYTDYSSGRKITRCIFDDEREDQFYKFNHPHHPSAIWTRQSRQNYIWLHQLWVALAKEFEYRFHHPHTSYVDLKDALKTPPKNMGDFGLTPILLAMPDKYKSDDAVESYRAYYRGSKRDFAVWSSRDTPNWFKEVA